MDVKVIRKSIDDAIVKCGRDYLSKADKEFVEEFKKNRENYRHGEDAFAEYCELQYEHDYSPTQYEGVNYWGGTGFIYVNGRIYKTNYYEEQLEKGLVDDGLVVMKTKFLDSAIDDGFRVPFDIVTERLGHWDEGHKEGDVVVLKGFASTSLTNGLPVSDTDEEHSFVINYYIPTGSRGIALDSDVFSCLDEDEILLGRKSRQYVLEQDDDAHTVDILILPDR